MTILLLRVLALVGMALFWAGAPARALPLVHGDFAGASVFFLGVQENSATDPLPLLGAPVVAGDSLDWSPVSLGASSGLSADATEVIVSLRVRAAAGAALERLVFEQGGDTTLIGLGGAATAASIASSVSLEVLETLAGPAAGPALVLDLAVSPSDGTFDLGEDGQQVALRWNAAGELDLASAVPGGASLVAVTWTTRLETSAEPGGAARIALKDAKLAAAPGAPVVPEPHAFALWASALAVAGLRLRRTSRA